MSFESVLKIIKYFKNKLSSNLEEIDLHSQNADILNIVSCFLENRNLLFSGGKRKTDELFSATDPFDIKWMTDSGKEKDYNDIASSYWNLMGEGKGFLYTSTAVPVEEELSILKFSDDFIKRRESGAISSDNLFRISQTKANSQRVQNLKNILEVFVV